MLHKWHLRRDFDWKELGLLFLVVRFIYYGVYGRRKDWDREAQNCGYFERERIFRKPDYRTVSRGIQNATQDACYKEAFVSLEAFLKYGCGVNIMLEGKLCLSTCSTENVHSNSKRLAQVRCRLYTWYRNHSFLHSLDSVTVIKAKEFAVQGLAIWSWLGGERSIISWWSYFGTNQTLATRRGENEIRWTWARSIVRIAFGKAGSVLQWCWRGYRWPITGRGVAVETGRNWRSCRFCVEVR